MNASNKEISGTRRVNVTCYFSGDGGGGRVSRDFDDGMFTDKYIYIHIPSSLSFLFLNNCQDIHYVRRKCL